LQLSSPTSSSSNLSSLLGAPAETPMPKSYETIEALSPSWQIILVILYTLTAILALIENLIVVFVQANGRRFETLIRKSLINLAVSDILLGVLCVPFVYTDFMLGKLKADKKIFFQSFPYKSRLLNFS
jgi:hypothetical protein